MLPLGETGQSVHRISLSYFLQLHVDLQLPQLNFQLKIITQLVIDAKTTFYDALQDKENINWGYIHVILNILNHVSKDIRMNSLRF